MRSRNDSSWDVDYKESLTSVVKRQNPVSSPDSVLAAHCIFRGDVELRGKTQINGQLEGEISSEGELIIGEEAYIKANIFGRIVIIFGRVEGHIKCTERLEIHAGAHVTGDVLSPRVVIQDGVVFEGRCWMGEEQLRAQS